MAKAFAEAFPVALTFGMTYDQFWLDDPWLFTAYREADRLAQERKAYDRWLTGMYVYDAIGRLVPVLNPFSKSHKAERYPDRPFEVAQAEEDAKSAEELEQESHDRTAAWLASFKVG